MLKIQVRNFRGCERADVVVNGITLIAGRNHQGKTSIMRPIAAALARVPVPFFDIDGSVQVLKKDMPIMVKGGCDVGGVKLMHDADNFVLISWPQGTIESKGATPTASVYAVDLVPITRMDKRKRMEFLTGLLQAAPTEKDLINHLGDNGFTEDEIKAIWCAIEIQGWDVAHKQYKDEGATLKGRWQQATGEKYGTKKAAEYSPQHYTEELEALGVEKLDTQLANARQRVENLIAKEAVSSADIQRLGVEAAREKSINKEMNSLDVAMDGAEEKINAIKAQLNGLPSLTTTLVCPHCTELSQLHRKDGVFSLVKADISAEEFEKHQREHERLSAELAQHEKDLGALADRERELKAELKAIAGASQRKIEAEKNTVTAEQIMAARLEVEAIESRRNALVAKHTADTVHTLIAKNQIVVDALAEDGLRRAKLVRALEAFNEMRLRPLCDTAGFRAVMVTDSFDFTLGGRPFVMLSQSEKFRVEAVLKIAVAQLDGSDAVLLDDADVLDAKGRNGLFALLSGLKDTLSFVVAMTINKPHLVPDLDAAGLGRSYWIEDGACRRLSEAMAATA